MKKLALLMFLATIPVSAHAQQRLALATPQGQERNYTPVPARDHTASITCRGTSGQTATCNTNCCTSNNGYSYYCAGYNGTCP
jgi:hypothetical protein